MSDAHADTAMAGADEEISLEINGEGDAALRIQIVRAAPPPAAARARR